MRLWRKEPSSSVGGGGIKADDSVDLRQLQRALHHSLSSRNSHSAAGTPEARITRDDGSDGGAVDVRNTGEVEDHVRLALAKHGLELVLDTLAVGAGMNTALHLQHGDAGLMLAMRDLHGDNFGSQRRNSILDPKTWLAVLGIGHPALSLLS